VNSKQARIIFDECKKMILSSPALKKRLEIKDTNKKIIYRPSSARSNWSPSMRIAGRLRLLLHHLRRAA